MASNQAGAVTIEAREALCDGLCHVLATLPRNQQGKPFQVLFIPTLECLRTMTKLANECNASSQGNDKKLDSVLVRVSDEIRILSVMAETYQKVTLRSSVSDESQGEEPFLSVLRKAWPSVSHVAESFNKNEVCVSLFSCALSRFTNSSDLVCSQSLESFVGVAEIPHRLLTTRSSEGRGYVTFERAL